MKDKAKPYIHDRVHALAVDCPRSECGARVGHFCKDTSSRPHQERIDAAKQAFRLRREEDARPAQ